MSAESASQASRRAVSIRHEDDQREGESKEVEMWLAENRAD